MLSGINTIVSKHFELFFRDMTDKPGNEFHCRNTLGNSFIIFVSGIVESYIFSIVVVDTGRSNHRPPKVSADVFNGNRRSTAVRLGTDIKAIGIILINIIFDFVKRRT